MNDELRKSFNRMYALGNFHGLDMALMAIQTLPRDEAVAKISAMIEKARPLAMESMVASV